MNNNITQKIRNKLTRNGKGWVFSLRDLYDLGKEASVRQAVKRLKDESVIIPLGFGLYYYPEVSKYFGNVSPNVDEVAKAIARKGGEKIISSGAKLANLAGFTTQIPISSSYSTSGKTRIIKISNMTIHFKNTKVFPDNSKEIEICEKIAVIDFMAKICLSFDQKMMYRFLGKKLLRSKKFCTKLKLATERTRKLVREFSA